MPAAQDNIAVMIRIGVLYALLSGALFGISTPLAKLLLDGVQPVTLAGLLYCGAGAGIAALRRWRPATSASAEVPVNRADLPWLGGAIAAGGIVAPLLLMLGLARTDAATASLLLTCEGAATALIAWFVVGENFDRRIALGMVCILAGAAILSWTGVPTPGGVIGPLAILGACLGWGIDNNLMRRVSMADPLQIVQFKGLVAGPFSLALGFWVGEAVPSVPAVAMACIVGFFSYGVSLALFVLALRHIGAARTGAYFSTAPFLGSAAAVIGAGGAADRAAWRRGRADGGGRLAASERASRA